MLYDWDAFLDRMRRYPCKFLPPCQDDLIAAVEKNLGSLPSAIKEMLKHFNGAELFIATGPLLTVFGLSTVPLLPPLEWGEDWYIDKFTPSWRASSLSRDGDWAIGMMNYDGVILFNEHQGISEWDRGESRWLLENLTLSDWIERVISDGETMMAELKQDEL
jgi:hypothetical protein